MGQVSKQHLHHEPLELHDTPDALNIDGIYDDEETDSEVRAVAVPAHGVSLPGAIRRFYGNYWNSRGGASASEFWWAMLWVAIVTVLLAAAMSAMGDMVTNGTASSLVRTVYMLMYWLVPLWIMANIGPFISLIRRRLNAKQGIVD